LLLPDMVVVDLQLEAQVCMYVFVLKNKLIYL
jgi:hypothetical protein